MKVTLNKEMTAISIEGGFNLVGVPTAEAQKIASGETGKDGKALKGDPNGLNHGSTGFPIASGTKFKDEDGNEREIYVGVNVTSHLVKGGKAKPKF
jgi:hypothetical protein